MGYTKFTIRNKKPTASDKYAKCYIRKDEGWSWAVIGSPTDPDCNVLSNCVGYAQGRFCEIYNEITGTTGNKYKYLNCNAENFVERAKESYPDLQMGNDPRPGAIMCWQKGTLASKDGAGHVAVVEQVIDNDTVLTSESGWGNSKPFWNQTRKRGSDGNWGYGTFRCFIYNPAVANDDKSEPEGYTISIDHSIGGIVSTDKATAKANEDVVVTAAPDEGYQLDRIIVNDFDIEGTSFVMPSQNVVVSGVFSLIPQKDNILKTLLQMILDIFKKLFTKKD